MSQKGEDLRVYIHCGSEIGKSQPWSKVGNFDCLYWLNVFFFGGGGWGGGCYWGFLKEGVKTTYLMTQCRLLTRQLFSIVSIIVYGEKSKSGYSRF
jgi:hypothetical protein